MSSNDLSPQAKTQEDQPELVINSPDGSTAPDADRSATPDAELVEFPDFGERYEVLARIGQGGMGSVYKVLDQQTCETVAIKSLQVDLAKDATALKRFELEAEAASQLTHPNLVSVFGHGTTDSGTPYIVMDYLEGRSLAAVLEDEGCLSPERAVDLFIQIAEGLAHVHEKGIIHRDIKPTNVILTRTGDLETARLVDFGIATILPSATRETCDLTKTGDVFGSPHYMSPEQCLGFLIDQRSDVYSLGCLMYEVVTGHPPFSGSTPVQLVVGHINNDAPPFSRALKANKTIAKLEGIILRCLEKEQALRFQTASELHTDLELVKGGKPIPKYLKSAKTKPMLTKRQALGALALVFVCIFCLPSLNSWFGHFGFFEVYGITSRVVSFMEALVCAGGIWAFLSVGLERLRKIRDRKATPRQWSLIILLCSAGLLGCAIMPDLILDTICGPNYELLPYAGGGEQIWRSAMAFWLFIFGGLFAGQVILSSLVHLFAVSQRKVGPLFVPIRMALLAVASLVILFCCFPNKAAVPISMLASQGQRAYPDTALKLHRFVSKLDKENTSSLWSIVYLHADKKRYQEAISTISESMEREKPERLMGSYIQRADYYVLAKQYDNAEADVDKAISMDPKNSIAYCTRGRIRGLKNDFDGAISDYDTSIRFNPGSDNAAYAYRVGQYCAAKKYDIAFSKLDEMSMISKLTKVADLMRGLINEHLGRSEIAKKNFESLVANEKSKLEGLVYGPDYYNRHFLVAFAYHKLGLNKESTEQLKKSPSHLRGFNAPPFWRASDTEILKRQLHFDYANLSSLE